MSLTYQYIYIAVSVFVVVGIIAIAVQARMIDHLKHELSLSRTKAINDVAAAESRAEQERLNLSAQHSSEMDMLRQQHAATVEGLRRQHAVELQRAQEHIENRREVLRRMDEKSLLVDVVLALDGYGGRLQRLETSLDSERVTERIGRVSEEVSALMVGMSGSLHSQIVSFSESIDESLRSFDIHQLAQRIEDVHSEVNNLLSAIDNFEENMSDEVSSLSNDLSSMRYVVNEISSDLNTVESDVDDIKSEVADQFGFDTLRSMVSEIKSAVEGAD